jgi:alditol oxidase
MPREHNWADNYTLGAACIHRPGSLEEACRVDRHLWATEIRSMAGDRLWLSPAYADDRVGIHFSWLRETDADAALTAEIEAMLLPFGARPHWGKIMHADAPQLAPVYPQLPAFRALARSYDPGGKFRNQFLDTHVRG